MPDCDDTLDDGFTLAARRRARRATTSLALCIAWSSGEPDRVGDVALCAEGQSLLLGRGGAREDDATARATFVRQRPGSTTERPPLGSRFLSRQQLVVQADHRGLWFRRVGRNAVFVNGIARDEGVLRPGDVLRLDGHLVLLCTTRPRELPELTRHPAPQFAFGAPDPVGLVGESPRAWALRDELALHAAGQTHVLLLGPSGAGKELAARALHLLSQRADRPLVARNASTIPETLIDAELFGNARNYPNPGMRERPGLIGEAHGTTLFLDEIGEAPHAMQAHLLRLLDGGEYHRLGESAARRAQLFVVGATNRELGELKHDFVARFTVRLIVPSLQERREDIPLVLAHLVRTAAARSPALARFCDGDGQLRAEAQLIEALLRHAFALNVRELEEILLRAAAASAGDTLSAIDLAPPDARRSSLPPPPRLPSPDEVAAAMLRNGGNRSHAWRELGLRNRYVLYRLLRKGGASGAARAARGHRGTGAAPRE